MLDENFQKDSEKRKIESKILKMQLIVKCADVCHPARPLKQHLEWSRRIRDEFFDQGDRERSKGMKISPLCDRNIPLTTYPQGQIGFINYVSKPLFNLLSSVLINDSDEQKPWLRHIEDNLVYWAERKLEADKEDFNEEHIFKLKIPLVYLN